MQYRTDGGRRVYQALIQSIQDKKILQRSDININPLIIKIGWLTFFLQLSKVQISRSLK